MRFSNYKSMAFVDAAKQKQREVQGSCTDEDVLYRLTSLPDNYDDASSYVRQQNLNLDAYLTSEAATKSQKIRDGKYKTSKEMVILTNQLKMKEKDPSENSRQRRF